ncbi:hypothetical protein ACTU3I_08190 [Microbacterium sp. RD1]|uniref:hypothetical protein n=1 Tax=Microbacterium sp. RD1 TaxID=3457313 RepID=UPI003FA57DE9
MTNALEAVVEIFSWVGIGAGVLLGGIALLVLLADGRWAPVRGFIEHEPEGAVIRWFDEDGDVNSAPLTPEQVAALGDGDAADVYALRGAPDRMRITRRSPALRGLAGLAGVFLGVGVLALVVSIVLLFVE